MSILKDDLGDLKLTEVVIQQYTPGAISGGFVEGHPVDTLYIKFHANQNNEDVVILLRPDEVAALGWVCTGVLYSHEMQSFTSVAQAPLISVQPIKRDVCPRCGGRRQVRNEGFVWVDCPVCGDV